jgi:hypothetical protein
VSAELPAGRRWLGNSQVLLSASHPQGWRQGRHWDAGSSASEQERTNSPRSGQVLSRHRPWFRVPSGSARTSWTGPEPAGGRWGEWKGPCKDDPVRGTQAHKQKNLGFCNAAYPQSTPERAWTAGDARWASHEAARGRGPRERAPGLTRLGSAARMLSPALLPAGRETRRSEEGGGALAQPPLTGAGSAAAAALSVRALPEPGLACAPALPRRRRRLLCSSSSSGRHGQNRRGAHPRAARYEVALVYGTPSPCASQTQCLSARAVHPKPAPPAPSCILTPRRTLPLHPSSGIAGPGASSSALLASPYQDLPVLEPPVPLFGDRCSSLALPGTDFQRS